MEAHAAAPAAAGSRTGSSTGDSSVPARPSSSAAASQSSSQSPSRAGIKRPRPPSSSSSTAASTATTLGTDDDDDHDGAEARAPKRLSASPSTAATTHRESLLVSNEVLRSENAHLQSQLAALEAQRGAQAQRIRGLEADMMLIYRKHQRETENREAAHREALARLEGELTAAREQPPPNGDPRVQELLASWTPETIDEMAACGATFERWQARLTQLSLRLAENRVRHEAEEVRAVVGDLVARVAHDEDTARLQQQTEQVEIERLLVRESEAEIRALVARIQGERQEVEDFEAMEREILQGRLAALEKSLEEALGREERAQEELARVRAEADEQVAERTAKLADEATMREQLETLTIRCESQNLQTTVLREELERLQAENERLVAAAAAADTATATITAQQPPATTEELPQAPDQDQIDATAAVIKDLEARISELTGQLAEMSSTHEDEVASLQKAHERRVRALEEELEGLSNRVEILNMNISAKAQVISELQTEKREVGQQMTALKAAVEELESEKKVLMAHAASANGERADMDQLTRELEEQRARSERRIEDLQRELDAAQGRLAILEQQLAEEQREKHLLALQVDEHRSSRAQVQRQMDEDQTQRQQLEKGIAEHKSQRVQLEAELTKVRQDHANLQNQETLWRQQVESYEAAKRRIDDLVEQEKQHTADLTHAMDALNSATEEKRMLEKETESLRLVNAELQQQLTSAPVVPEPSKDPAVEGTSKLLREKALLQEFLRRHFATAEEKCRALRHQVADLQAIRSQMQQQARDSCDLLQLCSQVDACDSAVRASIVDVMGTLKAMT